MIIESQKITAHLPKNLLNEACKLTGLGITQTLKSGLEKIINTKAYNKLSQLRGSYEPCIDLQDLREDKQY